MFSEETDVFPLPVFRSGRGGAVNDDYTNRGFKGYGSKISMRKYGPLGHGIRLCPTG